MTALRPIAAPVSAASQRDAVILVFPGRLCRAADRAFGPDIAEAARRAVADSLAAFQGRALGCILDANMHQLPHYPALSDALERVMRQVRAQALLPAEQIGARKMRGAAHDIARSLIRKAGLLPARDHVLLTGAWWDGTDEPIDLLQYAFAGMGFRASLDMAAMRPLPPAA